jgi:cytochrome c biogenesis protein
LSGKEKNILEKIWGFLASLKLAIVVLLLLAVTSIIGTILPQEANEALTFLAGIVGDNTAPAIYNIFLKLNFFDMYHSSWFVALLVLFCVNLTVCSLEKLPRIWHIIQTPIHPLGERAIKNLPIKKELKIKASLEAARDGFLNSLKSSRYQPLEATEEGSVQLYSQKGRYTRLGVYVVHLSILLIFAGAIVGSEFGFDGFLNLPEGFSSSSAYTFGEGKEIPLGFTVKCVQYETTYYKGTYRPQDFKSDLIIYEDGQEVLRKTIEVNDPLTYKGITFYQSNYGSSLQFYPNAPLYPSNFSDIPVRLGNVIPYFILKVAPAGGQEQTLYLQYGESFEIPGTGIKGTISDFSPALARDPQTNRLYTFDDMMLEPAVAIDIEEAGKDKYTGWFLKRYPETWVLPGGHKIEFVEFWGMEYTGLQVSKDPGVWIIYLACIIMALGLYVAFFMSHKKIWIKLVSEKNSVRVLVGGSATKNRLGFEKEIESLLSKTSEAIEGRNKK